MGMTNFYMGSLRYSPCGRKRKTTALSSKRKKQAPFVPMKVETNELQKLREEQSKQYKSLMEEAMKDGTFNSTYHESGRKKESPKYTGTLIKGIATMHKSNAIPVINEEQAKDIARMRR